MVIGVRFVHPIFYISLQGVRRMANIRRRSEKSWTLTVEAGYDVRGKRIRKYKTVRPPEELLKTKKKLQEWLEAEYHKFKAEVETGAYISPEKMVFSEFVKEWEQKYAVKELEESTITKHMRHLKNHILPVLGHMRICDIKPIHILNLLDGLKRKDGQKDENGNHIPLSSGMKYGVYDTIKNILARAVEWKLIPENPAANIKAPKVKYKKKLELQVYDEKEVEQIFRVLKNEPFHWRMFITLALATGMRRSELLGLEWPMVDLDNHTIQIKQVIVKTRKGPIIKEPKSKTSNRVISLPDSVVEEMKEYRRHWLKEKMRMRDRWKENKHEWVFCNTDGTYFYPETPSMWWIRFTRRNGIRHIGLHDLRHTSATLLINAGVHAKIISERLGHSSITITMDTYGHVLQKTDKAAANKIDDLFRVHDA